MTNQDNHSKALADLRQKAEALARERTAWSPEDSAALSPEEIQRILHELQMQYIELEIQNEELRTAHAEIKAGRNRYFDLYEFAPVGYCTLSEHGLILEANLTAVTLLGAVRGTLIKQPLSSFIHKDDQEIFILHLIKRIETGKPQECELRLVKPDGASFWARLTGTAAQAEDGAPLSRVVISDINERKQAEIALRQSHAMLVRTEHIANVGSWEWDIAGDSVRWSDELFRIFGRAPAAGAPSFAQHPELYLPEDMQRLREAIERCVSQGAPYELELRAIRSNGEIRHCIAQGQPETDETDRVVRLVGSFQDITERKKQEEHITLLSRMLDDAPASITIHDVAGRFLYANRKTFSLHGYDENEFMAINLHDLEIPESETLLEERFRQIAEKGEASFEVGHFRKDGTIFPLQVLAKQVQWEGRPVVLNIASDISEQRMADERFRAANDASLDSLMLLRSDRDETGQVQDFVFVEVNRRTEEMLRMSRDQLLGKRLCEVLPINREAGFFEKYKQVVDTGVPLEEEFFMPHTNVPAAWYYHQVVKVHDGIFIYHRDIGQQKRAEAEREKLQAQLIQAQKMESVGRLAGGVAHDFNNMLSVILGNTELAMEKTAPDDPLHNNLGEIFSAAKRSADIARQLLAFARKQTIAPKVLELNDTVEEMLKMLRRLIGEDVDLLWRPGAGRMTVFMDPSQVDQILANLCVNARDAIGDVGNVTIETDHVRFDAEYCADHAGFVPGDYIMLAVSDDGIGMDKETLNHLFEPFFTTKGVGKGTGLGLSTVFGIVKQNNGFINVYSEPGKGTTIKIYLPLYAGKDLGMEAQETVKIPVGHGETVLIVEDETSILKLAQKMLARLGYKVLTARTPGEALTAAEPHIDLLITDVVMPEMNGRELSEKMQTHYPEIKVLYMSGYTADVIAHHGVLDAGVNFLQKPFSNRDLAVKVWEALEG